MRFSAMYANFDYYLFAFTGLVGLEATIGVATLYYDIFNEKFEQQRCGSLIPKCPLQEWHYGKALRARRYTALRSFSPTLIVLRTG